MSEFIFLDKNGHIIKGNEICLDKLVLLYTESVPVTAGTYSRALDEAKWSVSYKPKWLKYDVAIFKPTQNAYEDDSSDFIVSINYYMHKKGIFEKFLSYLRKQKTSQTQ